MTRGDKIRTSRIALNLSQIELAEKVGVTERSIYSYEQNEASPRRATLIKLAESLNATVTYLLDDDETDGLKNIDQELFLAKVKQEYGYKGVQEANEVVSRASALFAGGELDDRAKDIFFQSIREVYLESKAEASKKFSNRKRKSRQK